MEHDYIIIKEMPNNAYIIEEIPNNALGNAKKYQVITLWNTDYAEEIRSLYVEQLYNHISNKELELIKSKGIRPFLDEINCGHIWNFVLLGIVIINKSGNVSEYGGIKLKETQMAVGNVTFSNDKLWTNMPSTVSLNGVFSKKIIDILWWGLIGISVYYVLSELINILF